MTAMSLVDASRPAAQVVVSSTDFMKSTSSPLKPIQRATGSRKSIPAASAICASFRLSSQVACQRSGTLVIDMPPEQLAEKMPSLKRSLGSMRLSNSAMVAPAFNECVSVEIGVRSSRGVSRTRPAPP
jgi:hypothetical protein